MSLVRLTLRKIAGSPFRSALIFICIALVAGSTVWTTLLIQGAQENLSLSVSAIENPGVDFVVIPRITGYSSTSLGNINLSDLLINITSIPGVERASPQLLLSTLSDTEYCRESEMFLIAFDPGTDFSILAWLQEVPVLRIGTGEAVAGSLVSAPDGGNEIDLAGYGLKLVGHLAPTGTSLDQSVYVTLDTYQDILDQNQASGNKNASINVLNAPYILVKVEPGNDPDRVGALILKNIRGVSIFDQAIFFDMAHHQMVSLLKKIPWLVGIGWSLTLVWIGLIFLISVNERRREIGVLRALGSSRLFVFQSLLAEGFFLAFGGVLAGTILSILVIVLIRGHVVWFRGLPLASISPFEVFLLLLESLALALLCVFLAAIFPAWRISRQDPAVIMRG